MKTIEEIKRILAEHKSEIRQKYGVVNSWSLWVLCKRRTKETSDVDIIVELERPIGLKFFELCDYLENILGTKVDVLTLSSLKQKNLALGKCKREYINITKRS